MHELSIALGIIDTVTDTLADSAATGAVVNAVRVRVGALSGVSAGALEFAFSVTSAGTVLDGARLEIEAVPVRLWCALCAAEVSATPRMMRCPRCQTPAQTVLTGRELELTSIDVAD